MQKVLVLLTGGTIGGIINSEKLRNEQASETFLERLQKLPEFLQSSKAETIDPFSFVQTGGFRKTSFVLQELDPPFDSTDARPSHWRAILEKILSLENQYDGFVICHGTNTLCYTAAALSFALGRLEKPIILTGAQKPMFVSGSDGPSNLRGAILLAGTLQLKEVAVFFHDKLLSGVKCSKWNFSHVDAFHSPGTKPLATLKDFHLIDDYDPRNNLAPQRFVNAFARPCDVVVVVLTPCTTPDQLTNMLDHRVVNGAVLVVCGALNLPLGRLDITECLKTKAALMPIVVVSSCVGEKNEYFRKSEEFVRSLGLVSGGAMTIEAAVAKLCVVLSTGQAQSSNEEQKAVLQQNWAAEM